MQTLWQDLRFGARMIKKNPGFAAVAALAIALGIAAHTFIFSVTDALVLRPFSFPNEARLVALFERKPSIGIEHAAVSPGNVIEWRAQSKTLQEVVVMRSREYTLAGDGPPERYTGTGVSAAFFDALGVRAQLGRTFQTGEDEAGRAEVAVLRHDFWQKRFGGDPRIVGQQILLNDQPFTVKSAARRAGERGIRRAFPERRRRRRPADHDGRREREAAGNYRRGRQRDE
jgi:putative ABC transport system permease protein